MRKKTKEKIERMIYRKVEDAINYHKEFWHTKSVSVDLLNERFALLEKFLDIRFIPASTKTETIPDHYVSTLPEPPKGKK